MVIYMLEIVGLLVLPIITTTNTLSYLDMKEDLIRNSITYGKDSVLKRLHEKEYSPLYKKILFYGKELAKERFISGKYDKIIDKIINSYERS